MRYKCNLCDFNEDRYVVEDYFTHSYPTVKEIGIFQCPKKCDGWCILENKIITTYYVYKCKVCEWETRLRIKADGVVCPNDHISDYITSFNYDDKIGGQQ